MINDSIDVHKKVKGNSPGRVALGAMLALPRASQKRRRSPGKSEHPRPAEMKKQITTLFYSFERITTLLPYEDLFPCRKEK